MAVNKGGLGRDGIMVIMSEVKSEGIYFPVPGLLYLPPFFIISEIFKIFDYVESIKGELF